jgi:hypothetical protein
LDGNSVKFILKFSNPDKTGSKKAKVRRFYKILADALKDYSVWKTLNLFQRFRFDEEKTPEKNVPTKKAIIQAVEELKKTEGLIHEYAIPSTHDITDHLIKGTEFGKFTAKGFPTAEEFLEKIGALDWFKNESIKCIPSDDDVDADADAALGGDNDDDAGMMKGLSLVVSYHI